MSFAVTDSAALVVNNHLWLHPLIFAQRPWATPSHPARFPGRRSARWFGSGAARSSPGTQWWLWEKYLINSMLISQETNGSNWCRFKGSIIQHFNHLNANISAHLKHTHLLALSKSSLDCSSSRTYLWSCSLMLRIWPRSSSSSVICL